MGPHAASGRIPELMDEGTSSEEFDRSSYKGQVFVWVTIDYVKTKQQCNVVWICRRFTNPEHDDDDCWGCWIKINANDHEDVAVSMLHYCSYMGYQVVAEDNQEEPVETYDEETRRRIGAKIYQRYKKEALEINKSSINTDKSCELELKELFENFAYIHRLQAEMWQHHGGLLK